MNSTRIVLVGLVLTALVALPGAGPLGSASAECIDGPSCRGPGPLHDCVTVSSSGFTHVQCYDLWQ